MILGGAPIDYLGDDLAKGPGAYASRPVEKVRGLVVHHTASTMDVHTTAEFHVRQGAPGLKYTFWIDTSGQVSQALPLDLAPWSQGGAGSPVPFTLPNRDFFSVALRGDFSHTPPNRAQSNALHWLHAYLSGVFELAPDMILPHSAFKPTICPGAVRKVIEHIRESNSVEPVWQLMPETITEFQQALVTLDADLGNYGPNNDGVDGLMGPTTRGALEEFTGIEVMNYDSSYLLAAMLAELA